MLSGAEKSVVISKRPASSKQNLHGGVSSESGHRRCGLVMVGVRGWEQDSVSSLQLSMAMLKRIPHGGGFGSMKAARMKR